MSDSDTPSLHDQLSDANVPLDGFDESHFVMDNDAFPDAPLTDAEIEELAAQHEREFPESETDLVELLQRSLEIEMAKKTEARIRRHNEEALKAIIDLMEKR